MYRRFFAALLSLCLLLAFLPVPAARADTPETFTVTFLKVQVVKKDDGSTGECPFGLVSNHRPGETVTLTVPEMDGFQFREWDDLNGIDVTEGSKSTATIQFVMPSQDVHVRAYYDNIVPVYQVTMTHNIEGISRFFYPYYPAGQTVTVNASWSGYRFLSWKHLDYLTVYTVESKPSEVSFTMPERDVTLQAEFLMTKFSDVHENDYYYYPVMWASNKNITNGTSDTTFSPGNTCTTAQIITFLWRSQNSPEPAGANPFRDVDVNSYYGKAAVWAGEKGMVSGDTFNGSSPCTRAAVMQYLWILAGRPSAQAASFTDVPSGADYAQAVSWAVQKGVTNGKTETTFAPNETCTRGQIATFLYRNSK